MATLIFNRALCLYVWVNTHFIAPQGSRTLEGCILTTDSGKEKAKLYDCSIFSS